MSIVETRQGKIQGFEKHGLSIFKGVPFAKPPVGELRFQAPRPCDPWGGVLETTRWGGACPQETIPMMTVGTQSEDCLYLNVWTPACDGKKRPVMFWIHGGAFIIGSSAQGEYNGKLLAARGDVVVVSTNYRLGAFGFLHLADLLGPGFAAASNNGIRDQLAALAWVRDNIEAFGGDPANVTIFGESAGGMSVGTLLGAPASDGLFKQAIAQSGAAHNYLHRDGASTVAKALLDKLGIDAKSPQQLWSVDAAALVKAQRAALRVRVDGGPANLPQPGMTLLPVVDGDVLPQGPWEAVRDGSARGVALMAGSTREEWRLFAQLSELGSGMVGDLALPKATDASLPGLIAMGLPDHAAQAVETYKQLLEGKPPGDVYTAIETDRIFGAPARRLAEAQAKHNPGTWMYRVDFAGPMLGACHAIDVPLVFGDVDNPFGQMLTGGGAPAQSVSSQMQRAWLAFAHTGDPGHDGIPTWPAYDEARRATMIFDRDARVELDPASARREFWDGILPG